jgi:antitoxin ParD1/3/4/toxin ParE1/3/4
VKRYSLTPDARSDLREIRDYISRDSPDAAKSVLAQLRTAMQRLAETPGIGHLREDLEEEALRVWPVYSYLIIYRMDLQPQQIVRVLHGARDIGAMGL